MVSQPYTGVITKMDIVIISGVMNVRITAFVVTVLDPRTPGASGPEAEPNRRD